MGIWRLLRRGGRRRRGSNSSSRLGLEGRRREMYIYNAIREYRSWYRVFPSSPIIIPIIFSLVDRLVLHCGRLILVSTNQIN